MSSAQTWYKVSTPMHAAFVDFIKAFDSVNHEALWEVLEARGIHPKLISLIKDETRVTGCGWRGRGSSQSGSAYALA